MTFTTMWCMALAVALAAVAPGSAGADGGPGRGSGTGPAAVSGSVSGTDAGAVAGAGTGTGAGAAGCADGRCWPVTGPGPRGRPEILRTFAAPAAPWSAGHRGVDLRAGPSAAVRAVAAGEITFTGRVAGTGVVVVRLPGGLRTTYEPVRATLPAGTRVAAGEQVGLLTGTLPHCPVRCLHWGLLRSTTYLDPLGLLPASLLTAAGSRLLPVYGEAGEDGGSGPSGWRRRAGPW